MVALLCITIAPFVKLLKDPVSYEKRADGTYSVVDCYDNYNGKVIISSTYNGAPVTSIGQYVYSGGFQGCSLITSIEIPASITSISSSFYLTDSLTSIYYTGTVDAWSEIDFYSNPISNKKVDLYINNTLVTDVEIYSARKISKNAFYNYDKLESVTIGGGVREIGEDAFAECSILEDVLIRSDSVRSIGDYAFRYCNNLENLTIGHGVTSIGSHAFYGCNRLKNIAIPSSVTYIGSYAFNECQNIEIASIPAFAISYIPKTNLKTVAITSGESIDSYAFYECNNLTSVEISGSITSIDCEVFKGCTNLRSINYGGTMAEWDAIFKKPDWDSGMGDYTIYCSDGTISK